MRESSRIGSISIILIRSGLRRSGWDRTDKIRTQVKLQEHFVEDAKFQCDSERDGVCLDLAWTWLRYTGLPQTSPNIPKLDTHDSQGGD